jgi:protein tyrosine phosphatase (PTP) superfamily phosphohydrolase (DUF442 family)
MEYVHIGVDWNKPTREDVEQFFKVMDANQDKDILIHCAANYRASAFYTQATSRCSFQSSRRIAEQGSD